MRQLNLISWQLGAMCIILDVFLGFGNMSELYTSQFCCAAVTGTSAKSVSLSVMCKTSSNMERTRPK